MNKIVSTLAIVAVAALISGCAEKRNCNANKPVAVAKPAPAPAPVPAPVVEAPAPAPVVVEEVEQVIEEIPVVDEKTRAVQ